MKIKANIVEFTVEMADPGSDEGRREARSKMEEIALHIGEGLAEAFKDKDTREPYDFHEEICRLLDMAAADLKKIGAALRNRKVEEQL
jgi:hypothetical protein